jgi:hypothetical protein
VTVHYFSVLYNRKPYFFRIGRPDKSVFFSYCTLCKGREASLPEIYRTPQRRRNPRAKSSTTVMNKTHLHPVSIQTPPTVFKSFQHYSQFRQLMKLWHWSFKNSPTCLTFKMFTTGCRCVLFITVVEDLALGFLLRCGVRYISGKLASPPSTITTGCLQ